MKKIGLVVFTILIAGSTLSCTSPPSTENKLRDWYRGVWLSKGGVFTVWTDTHYFVVSAYGDSTSANIYCGSSQVRFTGKGIARKQVVRIRQLPESALQIINDYSMYEEGAGSTIDEKPLEINMDLFEPGTCNVKEGIIYDSVTEETTDYILLSTCNGDQMKIFSDGRSLYLPAGGDENWSYRIESW
jgi:hypothetical protein